MNTRNQEARGALRRERDDLLLAIDRCEETKTALHMNLRAMREERDALAAQVELFRDALIACSKDVTNAALVHYKMREAFTTPNTAADILKKRDARTLREAASTADRWGNAMRGDNDGNALRNLAVHIRGMADELESKNE